MWDELLLEAGLNEREVRSIMILGSRPKMKASELAKELTTTRLYAYNSRSRLQEMGIVTATADRPMLFSSLRINEAMEHIIQSRKQQLDRLVEGFDELSKGITETDASYEKQRRDIDDPRFAVLKERSHIYNRLQKDGQRCRRATYSPSWPIWHSPPLPQPGCPGSREHGRRSWRCGSNHHPP